MYYIINYVTNNDFNFNQILLKTVLIKKIFENFQKKHQKIIHSVELSSNFNDKFVLRCFNVLIQN